MRHKNFELKVLVGEKPIHEYEHKGNYFVEGRRGSKFELEFKNHTAKRVLVVPSVDGLSVTDGQPATADSMGYVVPAHGTLRIPGWRLDANGVASFIFEDKERSYVRTSTATASARAGVVGVLVFDETVQPIVTNTTIYTTPYITPVPFPYTPTVTPWQQPWWGRPIYTCGAVPQTATGVMMNANNVSASNAASPPGGTAESVSVAATGTITANNVQAEPVKKARRVQLNETPTTFEIGTGFGPKADFKTSEVQFNKGDEVATLAIYYDSKRNLEKRGIQVVRSRRTYLEDLPSPFQSTGCTPPPGWNG